MKPKLKIYSAQLVLIALLIVVGCQDIRSVPTRPASSPGREDYTPHEFYAHTLQRDGTEQSVFARQWLEHSKAIFSDPHPISLPYQEINWLAAYRPTAIGYRFVALPGEQLEISIDRQEDQHLEIFMDLFKLSPDTSTAPELVDYAESDSNSLVHLVRDSAAYLLRLQPIISSQGLFRVRLVKRASLLFPVAGSDESAVLSFFGDPRDAGQRFHQGVDIFARKLTPVIAVTDGYINRVSTYRMGGKIVWMRNTENDLSFYYAHLDTQLVSYGQTVSTGDTVGLVGNTGNARTTYPHLHFGVYRWYYGALDPMPFIRTDYANPEEINVHQGYLGRIGRLHGHEINFRSGPNRRAVSLLKLRRNTRFRIIGGTRDWYRVELENGQAGYLYTRYVRAIVM